MKYSMFLTLLAVAGVVGTTSGAHATAASTHNDNVDEVSLTSNNNLRSTILGAAKEDSIDQTERELPEVNRIINKKGKNPPFLEDEKIYDFNPGSTLATSRTDVTYSIILTGLTNSNMETGKTYEWQAGKGYLIALLVQARSQILRLSQHNLSSTFSSLALWSSSCRQASPCFVQDLSVRVRRISRTSCSRVF